MAELDDFPLHNPTKREFLEAAALGSMSSARHLTARRSGDSRNGTPSVRRRLWWFTRHGPN